MSDFASRIAQPRLQQLYAYWLGLGRDGAYPSRRDVDPTGFRFLLGHVFLVAIEPGPRFRYRLFGVNLARRAGYDLTGKLVDDIPAEDMRGFLRGHYEAMAAKPMPMLVRGERQLKDSRRFEMLLLPLSDSGAGADMILGALLYADPMTPEM
jgi:hypothetical protein